MCKPDWGALCARGQTGTGKTTCLISLCRQLLAQGVCPIIFSYHQDIDEKTESQLSTVRFIDFDGLGFDPIEIEDRERKHAHVDRVGALRDIFAAIFPDLGDLQ